MNNEYCISEQIALSLVFGVIVSFLAAFSAGCGGNSVAPDSPDMNVTVMSDAGVPDLDSGSAVDTDQGTPDLDSGVVVEPDNGTVDPPDMGVDQGSVDPDAGTVDSGVAFEGFPPGENIHFVLIPDTSWTTREEAEEICNTRGGTLPVVGLTEDEVFRVHNEAGFWQTTDAHTVYNETQAFVEMPYCEFPIDEPYMVLDPFTGEPLLVIESDQQEWCGFQCSNSECINRCLLTVANHPDACQLLKTPEEFPVDTYIFWIDSTQGYSPVGYQRGDVESYEIPAPETVNRTIVCLLPDSGDFSGDAYNLIRLPSEVSTYFTALNQ